MIGFLKHVDSVKRGGLLRHLGRQLAGLTAGAVLAGGLATLALAENAVAPASQAQQETVDSQPLTSDMNRIVEQALVEQRRMLEARRNEMVRWDDDAQAAFQAAFGTTSDEARRLVLQYIDHELLLNAGMTADSFRLTTTTEPDRLAVVQGSDPTIYLDPNFFSTRAAAWPYTRGGVVAHEVLHQLFGAEDHGTYGLRPSATLAFQYALGVSQFEPWRNAGNFEFYVNGAFDPHAAGGGARPTQSQNPPADSAQLVVVDDAPPPSRTSTSTVVGATSQAPPAPQPPANPSPQTAAPPAAPQMTDEQFRIFMAAAMRQFQQNASQAPAGAPSNDPAAAQQPDAGPTGDDAADDNDAPPENGDQSGPRGSAQLTFDDSQPRAGNNQGGRAAAPSQPYDDGQPTRVRQNRAYSTDGSSRPIGAGNGQYDAQGYYVREEGNPVPVRPNRVYSTNGRSRPVGRGGNAAATYRVFQAQSNARIAAQQGGSYSPAPAGNSGNYTPATSPAPSQASGGSSATPGGYAPDTSGSASSSRLVFDDNAPRQPAVVSPRANGTAAPTAGIELLK